MKINIRLKVTALLMFVALGPLVMSSALSYLSSKKALVNSIGEDFEIMSENLMDSIDNMIHERLNDTQFFITDSVLMDSETTNEEKSEILETHLFNLGFYNEISLTDAEGSIIASTDDDLIGDNVAEEAWYQNIENRFIGTSDFTYSDQTGKPTMILGNLLLDKYKNPMGVVFTELTWNGVVELLAARSKDAEIILVNNKNLEIGYSDDDEMILGRNWSEVVEKFEEGTSGFGVYRNGREYLYAFSSSDGYLTYEGYEWKIIMRVPSKIAFAGLNGTLNLLLFIMIGTLLIVAVIGYEASRNIAKPIQDMTKGVESISKGNLDLEIPTKSNDEIGFLAETFNKMARTVKKKNAQLTTSLRMAEEETQKYQTILENTKDAILLMSSKNNVIAANGRFDKIFNIDHLKLIGKTQDELIAELEKVLEDGTIKKEIEKLQEEFSDKAFQGEFNLLSPLEGAVKMVVTPITNEEEGEQGYLWIFRDITEEKEIEGKKFNFITVASHQVRTPLTAASWNIELLKEKELGDLNEKQEDALSDISIGVKKTIALAESLLDISKIEEGAAETEKDEIALKELLEEVLNEVSGMLDKKKLKVNIDGVEEEAKIKADMKDAHNIITNVILNAIMYSDEGEIKIKSSLAEGGAHVVLSVKDEGIGITPRDKEKMFTKFFRAPQAVKTHADGSGLGLFIAKKKIESNEGKIWFESEEGDGATFYLEFLAGNA